MKIEVEESALEAIKSMAQRLQDERNMLLVYLKDARDSIESWGSYAGSYFQEKHCLEEELAELDAIIAKCTAEPKVME